MVRSPVVVASIDLGVVGVPEADRRAGDVVLATTTAGIDPTDRVVG